MIKGQLGRGMLLVMFRKGPLTFMDRLRVKLLRGPSGQVVGVDEVVML